MVDTGDLKSPGSNAVPVRVRSPAPKHRIGFPGSVFLLSIIPNAESIRDFFVETHGISDYNIME